MNIKIIKYILGLVLKLEGVLLLLPCLTALLYREKEGCAFLLVAAICVFIGHSMSYKRPQSQVFYAREGFITVSLSWILLSFFGALPFCISGEIPYFPDALFEIVSGFTTTGASILDNVEALSHCSIMWRSFTHWIGGMGVLVFILAILPMTGAHYMYLMKAESPGPSVEKLVPRVKKTAVILYKIYAVLTILQIILLCITGMPVFDSLCISFGTAGTGGFGITNTSCASYSPLQQVIITVFMIMFGVNFNIYYVLLLKKFRQAFHSEELRTYLAVIAIAIALITYNIHEYYPSALTALRHAAFQVGSIITTTGYTSYNYDLWPELSKTILIILMFIGACAGSTGGGIKISRILIMIKTVRKEVFSFSHPHGVKKIKMDGRAITHETVRSVNIFIISYLLILTFSVLLISIDNYDFTTNFTAVAATLNNIGPGMNLVGASGNFGIYSVFSKFVLIFDMLVGRLEIFPLLVLFTPTAWRRN